MNHRSYIPARGDVLHINASPSAGREMAGRHFALCLSPSLYCKRSGLAIVVIGTSKLKPEHHPRFGFTLPIPAGLIRPGDEGGYFLCDCVHQIDFREREASYVTSANKDFVERALDLLLSAMEDSEE